MQTFYYYNTVNSPGPNEARGTLLSDRVLVTEDGDTIHSTFGFAVTPQGATALHRRKCADLISRARREYNRLLELVPYSDLK